MRTLKTLWAALSVTAATILALPGYAVAATEEACTKAYGGFLSLPTWYKYLNPKFENGECKIDFAFPNDIGLILLAVAEILLRLSVLVAVGFIIYGGFLYIFSQAEPDKTARAKWTIFNALIGMGIAMVAVIIVNLVARSLTR